MATAMARPCAVDARPLPPEATPEVQTPREEEKTKLDIAILHRMMLSSSVCAFSKDTTRAFGAVLTTSYAVIFLDVANHYYDKSCAQL